LLPTYTHFIPSLFTTQIEKIFIEGGEPKEDFGPDPFEVSDAATMLKYLQSVKK